MIAAFSYSRVSSREQQREGYSIPAQRKLLAEYARYRKPFDLIFERAKNEDWSGREDLNLRPPGPEL